MGGKNKFNIFHYSQKHYILLALDAIMVYIYICRFIHEWLAMNNPDLDYLYQQVLWDYPQDIIFSDLSRESLVLFKNPAPNIRQNASK